MVRSRRAWLSRLMLQLSLMLQKSSRCPKTMAVHLWTPPSRMMLRAMKAPCKAPIIRRVLLIPKWHPSKKDNRSPTSRETNRRMPPHPP